MVRSRVKLDLGPHGKVLASVVDFDDARAVAAGRFNTEPSSVQLYVSDGEDLWELHPSAFQDVIAENRVIVAKARARSLLTLSPTCLSAAPPPASVLASPTAVAKADSPRSGQAFSSTSLAQTSKRTGTIPSTLSTPSSRIVRPRASSFSSSSSIYSTSTSSSSSSSSSSASSSSSSSTTSSSSSSSAASTRSAPDNSSSSSSSPNEDRRSESVQDVTATSATVRTVIGPNGLPVSSKERWDPKTHRLMFQKLNEIISSETIYYTRKYTEERYRIFQLLIDNYGDHGIRGNFLRGRTAQALIARVSGVLRTARDRGEKIKQPFKFFFPNRKDDDLASRSATVPVAPIASASASNSGPVLHSNSVGTRAQTLPVQAGRLSRSKANEKPSTSAVGSASAEGNAPSSTQRNSNRGKGKGNKRQAAANRSGASGQANPPEIRRRTANTAVVPPAPWSQSRSEKRPANGNPTAAPQSKKQKIPSKFAPVSGLRHLSVSVGSNVDSSGQDSACYSDVLLSQHRDRSTSPRPRDARGQQGNQVYAQRSDKSKHRFPYRGRDTWIRARDEVTQDGPAGEQWEEDGRTSRPLPNSVPRLPSSTAEVGLQESGDDPQPAASWQMHSRGGRSPSRATTALFRAETRSPAPWEGPSPVPRGNRWRRSASSNTQLLSSERSPRTGRNAVERALDHLAGASADTTCQSRPTSSHEESGRGAGRRKWRNGDRSWEPNGPQVDAGVRDSSNARQSGGRLQGHHRRQQQEEPRRCSENISQTHGEPESARLSTIPSADRFVPLSPRTPPRID